MRARVVLRAAFVVVLVVVVMVVTVVMFISVRHGGLLSLDSRVFTATR